MTESAKFQVVALVSLMMVCAFLPCVPLTAGLAGAGTRAAANPVAYWDMDYFDSEVTYDQSGNSHNFTRHGGEWSNALAYSGLHLDGTSAYATVEDAQDLRPATLTVSIWLKPESIKDCGLVIKRSTTTSDDANWQVEMLSGGNIRFSYNDGSAWQTHDTTTSPVSAPNYWYHVVSVFSGGSISIYVNGELETQASGYPVLDTTYQGQVQVGRGWGGYFKGYMDEIAIYGRALTAQEISDEYAAFAPEAPSEPVAGPAELVGYWTFDEESSTQITDHSAEGNHGVLEGSGDYVKGKKGKALDFDGGVYVRVPHTNSLNLNAFTVDVWIYPTDYGGSNSRIMEKGGYLVDGGFGVEFNRADGKNVGAVLWDQNTGYTAESSSQIPLNEWTHLAVTYDGATLKLYVNGKLAETLDDARMSLNDEPLTIGRAGRGGYDYFKGYMDEIRIYNGALTVAEIEDNYHEFDLSGTDQLFSDMEDRFAALISGLNICFLGGFLMLMVVTTSVYVTVGQDRKKKALNRFKVAKAAGFGTSISTTSDRGEAGKHIEGKTLFEKWKDAIASSKEAKDFISKNDLDAYKLKGSRKLYAGKVEVDEETEERYRENETVAGGLPQIYKNPEPNRPKEYKNDTQKFALSGRTESCQSCGAKGYHACGKCGGTGRHACETCSGKGHIPCKKCDGTGHYVCKTCDGKGRIDCKSCGGSGSIHHSGGTTWVHNTGGGQHSSSYDGHTTYSSDSTCKMCNGRGSDQCGTCHGIPHQNCEVCKSSGHLPCEACGEKGDVACQKCGATGRVTCSACEGTTKVSHVENDVWKFTHRRLDHIIPPEGASPKEEHFKDLEMGVEEALPDGRENLASKGDAPGEAKSALESCEKKYGSWTKKNSAKVLLEDRKYKLLPVTECEVEITYQMPARKRKDRIRKTDSFKIFALGGRLKAQIDAGQMPEVMTGSGKKGKLLFRFLLLLELFLLSSFMLGAMGIVKLLPFP